DRAAVELRLFHDADERGVTAITPADDADARRVRDSLVDEPVSARGDVIVHDRAPGLVTGVLPFLAVTRRTAEVQLQHGIATVGQQLHQRIVTPPVARLGPAVRQ